MQGLFRNSGLISVDMYSKITPDSGVGRTRDNLRKNLGERQDEELSAVHARQSVVKQTCSSYDASPKCSPSTDPIEQYRLGSVKAFLLQLESGAITV